MRHCMYAFFQCYKRHIHVKLVISYVIISNVTHIKCLSIVIINKVIITIVMVS
jgi:hypothetical protein